MITVKELIDFLKQFPDDFGVFKYGCFEEIKYAECEDGVICLFDTLSGEEITYYDFTEGELIHHIKED